MATKSMAYDHPAYLVPQIVTGEIGATASSKSARFACFTAMALKSTTATVITAGGTVCAIDVIRQAANGTALTTMASITNVIGTSVGGVTTNVLSTHASASALAQGDILWAQKGAGDGVGVFAIAFELVVLPGSTITA